MTPEQRAELRRLAEAASPGPWRLGKTGDTESHWVCAMDDENVIQPENDHACRHAQCEFDADAAFIAASRSAIPALLDALEEAERNPNISGVEAAILAARDAVSNDAWKQHILDGTAHLNLAYAEGYTEYKHRARVAESRLRKAENKLKEAGLDSEH